ncbi:hypothetical protein VTG60DRAFT_847 [Thermothelomyces hinnuleus]
MPNPNQRCAEIWVDRLTEYSEAGRGGGQAGFPNHGPSLLVAFAFRVRVQNKETGNSDVAELMSRPLGDAEVATGLAIAGLHRGSWSRAALGLGSEYYARAPPVRGGHPQQVLVWWRGRNPYRKFILASNTTAVYHSSIARPQMELGTVPENFWSSTSLTFFPGSRLH